VVVVSIRQLNMEPKHYGDPFQHCNFLRMKPKSLKGKRFNLVCIWSMIFTN